MTPQQKFDILIGVWLRLKESGLGVMAAQVHEVAVKFGRIHGFFYQA